jgi:serine/threonine-protein kinase
MYPPGAHERCPNDDSLLYVLGHDGPVQKPWGIGDEIAKKYVLIDQLKRKVGAGESFIAEQRRLKRTVELRLLPSDGIMKPGDQARFQREVSTWARLRSPFIVRLYDYGFTNRDEPYIILEFTNEGTLGDLIRQRGHLAYQEAFRLSKHLLQALDIAHQAQVMHRNLNPDAVVLHTLADGTSHYRLTGFAVAKHIGDEDNDPTAITMTGHVVCDPAYMAPESILKGILEPRTDLYALGVTLYEAFAGQRPFPGETLSELLAAHVQGTITPLEYYRPDIPIALKNFITKLLHKEPEHRYVSALEALEELEHLQIDFDLLEKNPVPPQERTYKPLQIRQGFRDRLFFWCKSIFRK